MIGVEVRTPGVRSDLRTALDANVELMRSEVRGQVSREAMEDDLRSDASPSAANRNRPDSTALPQGGQGRTEENRPDSLQNFSAEHESRNWPIAAANSVAASPTVPANKSLNRH